MKPILLALPGAELTARRLAHALGAALGVVEWRHFPDGESYVRVKTRLANRKVVVVAELDRPDDKFLPLLFLASAAHDLGARAVGLVCPYLPYMRQDKQFMSGEAVTSTYFARSISAAFDWLVTVDPHLHRRKSLSEIYVIPSVAVHATPLIAAWIHDHVQRPVLVGPDGESAQWVAAVALQVDAPYTVLRKRRLGDRSVKVSPLNFVGRGKPTPIVIDDIVSTGGTMIETVKQIRSQGGASPVCIAVHPLFVGESYRELRRAGASRIVSSNTIRHRSNTMDVTELLATAIASQLKGVQGRSHKWDASKT
ncbi:ribose-phosphate pyrophosphokinase [Reyranella sp.]|uniref:ribose-phosphate pyrophosphokinase n=1 Tax=Reyranella sp. TaxID=1929291 RepID=UPI00378409C2